MRQKTHLLQAQRITSAFDQQSVIVQPCCGSIIRAAEGVAALLFNYSPDAQDTVSLFLSPTCRPGRLPLPASGMLAFEDRQPDHRGWPLGVKFDRRGDCFGHLSCHAHTSDALCTAHAPFLR
ncbi:hypothetical protein PO883_10305 [Massilia sp. DJPM01]|uniref:hypothetical protein n=1 Tax=Massilia sp. DJPM01 TaxID=3024404 RepID=UPI00259DBD2E|nr:hypothetical protein [Massilia sp. DJPM01]MDM5177583.1 hypothetical protein [Massilia sp. DJPM01]